MIESDEILVKDNLCCSHMWGKVDVAQIHTILVNGKVCSILVPRWCHVECLSVDLRIKTATLPEEQSRGMLNKQVFFNSLLYSSIHLRSLVHFLASRISNFESFRSSWFPLPATGGISLIFPSAFPSKGTFASFFYPPFPPSYIYFEKSVWAIYYTRETSPLVIIPPGGTQKMTKCPRQSSTFSHILDELKIKYAR